MKIGSSTRHAGLIYAYLMHHLKGGTIHEGHISQELASTQGNQDISWLAGGFKYPKNGATTSQRWDNHEILGRSGTTNEIGLAVHRSCFELHPNNFGFDDRNDLVFSTSSAFCCETSRCNHEKSPPSLAVSPCARRVLRIDQEHHSKDNADASAADRKLGYTLLMTVELKNFLSIAPFAKWDLRMQKDMDLAVKCDETWWNIWIHLVPCYVLPVLVLFLWCGAQLCRRVQASNP